MDPLKYIIPGRKRLPYGMMNFADIRKDNYLILEDFFLVPYTKDFGRITRF